MNGCNDCFRRRTRIWGIADRSANDDVVGAIGKRLRHADHPFLIVRRSVLDRANSWGYHQKAIVDFRAQARHLKTR